VTDAKRVERVRQLADKWEEHIKKSTGHAAEILAMFAEDIRDALGDDAPTVRLPASEAPRQVPKRCEYCYGTGKHRGLGCDPCAECGGSGKPSGARRAA
jgi:hypothetical protein